MRICKAGAQSSDLTSLQPSFFTLSGIFSALAVVVIGIFCGGVKVVPLDKVAFLLVDVSR